MIVLGLTGSIGMGKTAAARSFARLGVPVFEADAVVHELLGRGGAAVAAVGAAFPGTVCEGAVDRRALGERVFGDSSALRRLEAILHPRVAERRRRFLRMTGARRSPLVVLDIPLLFETKMERECGYVAVVSAPAAVQRRRVLARPGMTEAKLAAILDHQIGDAIKRRRADFVIPTGGSRRRSLRRIREIVTILGGRRTRGRRSPVRQGRRRPRKGWAYARSRARYRNHGT